MTTKRAPTLAQVRAAKAKLYKVRAELDELIALGSDYAYWQSAQATHKHLKAARRELTGIG